MRRPAAAGLILLTACAASASDRPGGGATATPSPAPPAAAAAAPAAAAVAPAPALEQEIRRIAARAGSQGGLWPGFDPLAIPLAVFDGRRTWFFRHPSPPSGCVPAPGAPQPGGPVPCILEGRHEAITANSSAEIEGVATATVLLDDRSAKRSLEEQAALAVHEDFHVFQRLRHPGWIGNEADLFTYPVDSVELLAARRLESEALKQALAAGTSDAARCWGRRALAQRSARYGRMDPPYPAYERGTELNEGLASYIQIRAAGRDLVVVPEKEFGPAEIRPRTYVTGPALAILLDRFDPGWKKRLEENDKQTLDGLLAAALGAGSEPICRFAEGVEARAAEQARADIAARASDLARRLAAFEAKPGWRVVVEAAEGRPLRAQGFDPLNVERIAGARVLHTRYVALGNDAGRLEVMDAASLTEGVGPHPLFGGVKRFVVTGLPEPRVTEENGRVRLTSPGLTLDFQGATVTRDSQAMTIRLGAS